MLHCKIFAADSAIQNILVMSKSYGEVCRVKYNILRKIYSMVLFSLHMMQHNRYGIDE